jgi:hypothetical protein
MQKPVLSMYKSRHKGCLALPSRQHCEQGPSKT